MLAPRLSDSCCSRCWHMLEFLTRRCVVFFASTPSPPPPSLHPQAHSCIHVNERGTIATTTTTTRRRSSSSCSSRRRRGE